MEPAQESGVSIESRLAAVESTVTRLSAIVEPGVAVGNIASPIAMLVLKESGLHGYHARFFVLLDIGESLLKYSSALAFAAVLSSGGTQGEAIRELFKAPVSLGKLTAMFRQVLDDKASLQWPLQNIRLAFRKTNGKATPIARYLLDEFISLRNDARGHSSQQPDGYYEDLYKKNHLIIQDCVSSCLFLALPLLHIHSMDHAEGHYSYAVTMLMGGSPVTARSRIVTSAKIRVGSTCLWDTDKVLLNLFGLVSYRYCQTCSLEHVFFADRITSAGTVLHSYLGNHRMTIPQEANDF